MRINNVLLALILMLCLSFALIPGSLNADNYSVNITLKPLNYDSAKQAFEFEGKDYGMTTSPGSYQLPTKLLNILLPPGAQVIDQSVTFSSERFVAAPEPNQNGGFASSEQVLLGSPDNIQRGRTRFFGVHRFGDIHYARFLVLPAIYDQSLQGYQISEQISINLVYDISTELASSNRIPPSLLDDTFFANPELLTRHYQKENSRNYDYLIVTTPELYAAASSLVAFRQSQGLVTEYANIATILNTSPGSNAAEKLRNYLIQQYNLNPFTYLLLIGDIDVIPIAQLTPEPNGFETIPSDFYFSDLSSIFDTDSDGCLGEYSSGIGDQDWLVDYTPELFVGRIAWNTSASVTTICDRIVSFEQSQAPWKEKALLPAAFLNYQNEGDEFNFAQTDGADFMELVKQTIISSMQTTTLYEQTGAILSYPSDFPLDSTTLRNQLNTESYGLLNWSAHGSATSSSRKVWIEDSNNNGIPESYEMEWMGMVNRQSFDNLANQDGMVVFCASCYNGMIDHTSASLAEHVLLKKGVAAIGATRTGWYKIGWRNPGWGGISSLNYHWLENYKTFGMPVGAAHAYSNLLHTQYYLFGDPIDSGGIIWPELQNVYTYLLYGDPAIGHTPVPIQPAGEILVWEPIHHDGLPVVNAINAAGNYNVIYTDKLIPDYQYIDNFEAVFCLFGFGDTSYILEPNSLEYNLLNGYLENGGKVYLEGWVAWDAQDSFWQKFGTSAPYDHLAYIDMIRHETESDSMLWTYDSDMDYTTALAVIGDTARPFLSSWSIVHISDIIAVKNITSDYATISSSFRLADVTEPVNTLTELLTLIINTLNEDPPPVENSDDLISKPNLKLLLYPNPFTATLKISSSDLVEKQVELKIYNIKGQEVWNGKPQVKNNKLDLVWNGTDKSGNSLGNGLYFIKLIAGSQSTISKAVLIK